MVRENRRGQRRREDRRGEERRGDEKTRGKRKGEEGEVGIGGE